MKEWLATVHVGLNLFLRPKANLLKGTKANRFKNMSIQYIKIWGHKNLNRALHSLDGHHAPWNLNPVKFWIQDLDYPVLQPPRRPWFDFLFKGPRREDKLIQELYIIFELIGDKLVLMICDFVRSGLMQLEAKRKCTQRQ